MPSELDAYALFIFYTPNGLFSNILEYTFLWTNAYKNKTFLRAHPLLHRIFMHMSKSINRHVKKTTVEVRIQWKHNINMKIGKESNNIKYVY
jgi:hypothetical protein